MKSTSPSNLASPPSRDLSAARQDADALQLQLAKLREVVSALPNASLPLLEILAHSQDQAERISASLAPASAAVEVGQFEADLPAQFTGSGRIRPLNGTLELEELWRIVVMFLKDDQKSLYALTLTSKLLKDIVMPVLYQSPKFRRPKVLLSFLANGNLSSKSTFTSVVNLSGLKILRDERLTSSRRFMKHILDLSNVVHLNLEGAQHFLRRVRPYPTEILATRRFEALRQRLEVLNCPLGHSAVALVSALIEDVQKGACRLRKLSIRAHVDEVDGDLLDFLQLVKEGKLPDLEMLALAGDAFFLDDPDEYDALDVLAQLSLDHLLNVKWTSFFNFDVASIEHPSEHRWEEAWPQQF